MNEPTILSPDKVTVQTVYTFTISPDDSFQFWNDISEERIKKATNHIKFLVRSLPNITINLTLDVSRKGRIHWHGTLEFKHINHVREFYLSSIPRLLKQHQIEVDTIKEMRKWSDYCAKTTHLWDITVRTSDVIKLKTYNSKNVFKDITTY